MILVQGAGGRDSRWPPRAEAVHEFDIYIEGFDDGGEESPEEALHRLFGLELVHALSFVESVPRVVKRRVPGSDVERYEAALREVGAHYELRPSPIEPLPVIAVVGQEGAGDARSRRDGAVTGRTLTLPPPVAPAGAGAEPALQPAATPSPEPDLSDTWIDREPPPEVLAASAHLDQLDQLDRSVQPDPSSPTLLESVPPGALGEAAVVPSSAAAPEPVLWQPPAPEPAPQASPKAKPAVARTLPEAASHGPPAPVLDAESAHVVDPVPQQASVPGSPIPPADTVPLPQSPMPPSQRPPEAPPPQSYPEGWGAIRPLSEPVRAPAPAWDRDAIDADLPPPPEVPGLQYSGRNDWMLGEASPDAHAIPLQSARPRGAGPAPSQAPGAPPPAAPEEAVPTVAPPQRLQVGLRDGLAPTVRLAAVAESRELPFPLRLAVRVVLGLLLFLGIAAAKRCGAFGDDVRDALVDWEYEQESD